MNSNINKALFLDRDGVINKDYGHVHEKNDFVFINGIFDLCKLAQKNKYIIIIVTNQAGIGKGYYSEKVFHKLNNWMLKKFEERGIFIANVYYCPHVPEEKCFCRKPNPGMLINAINDFMIDPSRSILIGDKNSDIISAKKANIKHMILFNNTNHNTTIKKFKSLRYK